MIKEITTYPLTQKIPNDAKFEVSFITKLSKDKTVVKIVEVDKESLKDLLCNNSIFINSIRQIKPSKKLTKGKALTLDLV